MTTPAGKKCVQYGAGWDCPEQWENYDASPTLCFERLPIIGGLYTKNKNRFPPSLKYGNIVKGLPLAEGSCDAVYCSHVIEHLTLEETGIALANTWRILKKGGTFRLVVPDLRFIAQKYMNNAGPDAAKTFLEDASLGCAAKAEGIFGFLSHCFGRSRHLWMWDYPSLEQELKKAGFVNIRRAAYHDSSDPVFSFVENESRWKDALGIECNK